MPRSPWLAIDAATPPALRAREVRREWEQFVGGGPPNGVRAPVADSWQRSLHAGVDPLGSRLAPASTDRQEASERWKAHPLADAAPLIRGCLAGIAGDSEHLIVVSDAAGVLLQVDGDAGVRSRAADSMNFTEGALWSEDGAGTNAVGTALAADHALQIFASEHFIEVVQAWTCSAAPVHDPETGALLGVIDLTGLERNVHPHSLAVVTTTARAVEGHLRYLLEQRNDRLRASYQRHLTGRAERRALVAATGGLVADDPRGWLRGIRIDPPPGGGEVALPAGMRAVAEPVGHDDAFILRELNGHSPRRRPRDELRMLADEHAALRRLATAVARDASPSEIFARVAEEIGPFLGADDAAVARFEPDHSATIVAGYGTWVHEPGVGMRVAIDEVRAVATVFRTGRSARVDEHDDRTPGTIGAYPLRTANRSVVASPITVGGRLWGAVVASTRRALLPADAEERMADFTELVGIVVANAESRAELAASRARVVAAGDEARRRIKRDLHDGAQARMVSTVMALKLARRELGDTTGPAVELVEEALAQAQRANGELRELAHGTLPGALSRGGLRAGIDALVSRVPLAVSIDVTAERFPPELEAAAYFILAEALTNAARHARASHVQIAAVVDGAALRLAVTDDGVGGARTDASSGLLGLYERAAALNGELRIDSPLGQGTTIAATLPIPAASAPI
jgi:signal transduction histidine kinase